MKTVLHFTTTGEFHCASLAPILRAAGRSGLKPVRIGGGAQHGDIGCESCPQFLRCGMSHTSEIKSSLTDANAILAACKELGLAEPKTEKVRLYDGKEYTGLAVRLKGWNYPVVIELKTGKLHYDNYGGGWGQQSELNKLTQMYGVAKATMIARKKGYAVQRTTMSNGTIRLQVSGM